MISEIQMVDAVMFREHGHFTLRTWPFLLCYKVHRSPYAMDWLLMWMTTNKYMSVIL
jgi:hypothetical protein